MILLAVSSITFGTFDFYMRGDRSKEYKRKTHTIYNSTNSFCTHRLSMVKCVLFIFLIDNKRYIQNKVNRTGMMVDT